MLVYGDPQFTCSREKAVALLQQTVGETEVGNLDSTRKLLIRLGQLEQAIADLESWRSVLPDVQSLTDLSAELFACALFGEASPSMITEINNALQVPLPPGSLTIKIPEGFEFYTLFPEQFFYSAVQWSHQHRSSTFHNVVVVGIRSIGTTLSAVVANALRREGWPVTRITVRPDGHPFNRVLKTELSVKATYAIIVDEGPGISGSSMVAAAQAVVQSGVARECVSFLPGHGNDPGNAATETVRNWWNTASRYFTPLQKLRWMGRDLRGTLLGKSTEISGKPFVQYEDLSGGGWRRLTVSSDLSPAFAPFERSKFICLAEDGSALLWKFNGLGSVFDEKVRQRASNLSKYVIKPIGYHHGFCIMPWIRGERLKKESITEPLIDHLAAYVVAAAKEPLSPAEHISALDRLVEMTFWNTKNMLGEAAAQQAITYVDAARRCNHLPAYGDGRLAPWEWIHTPEGQIIKTDWFGHATDHTLVGRQSILWDIAGLLLEWKCSEGAEQYLMKRLSLLKIEIDVDALAFFRSAYSAFQMGKSALCESITSNPLDQELLTSAKMSYCRGLWESMRRVR